MHLLHLVDFGLHLSLGIPGDDAASSQHMQVNGGLTALKKRSSNGRRKSGGSLPHAVLLHYTAYCSPLAWCI